MSILHRILWLGPVYVLVMSVSTADAQDRGTPAPDLPAAQASRIDASGSLGQLPTTATGQLGQRQTPGQAASNVIPGGRIEARINNRVPSRLNTRIGGAGYRTQADALSAYGRASEEASSTTRKIRR